ncbi:MAG: Dam family site-specific DNA-(adenine-N6)-methyltransferase [Saprospiraceae bacterium]|nr:Dam family site-specific DNA-(adenine-N6)-methyltransferase [Saprospiraceae bacterium]
MHPFLKWPGGKRWFIQRHADLLPKVFRKYVEPFLGGGAVFFHLQPQEAVLGDINADLINTYRGIQRDWRQIEGLLEHHQRMHSTEYYYLMRNVVPEDLIGQAARMLYLNRTCFNGIYRVNLKGEFNVPKGGKTAVIIEGESFEAISELLKRAELLCGDFEPLIDQAEAGDLVFVDPPYTVRHNNNGFIKYNEKLFTWEDQERLAQALGRARDRGAQIVSTNANYSLLRDIYRDLGFYLIKMSRFSAISAKAESRRNFEELIILSHPPKT